MRKATRYLSECVGVALRLTWQVADTVGIVIGIVLAIAVIALPAQQQSLGVMLAKATVWILAAVFLGRLLSAPYVLYEAGIRSLSRETNRLASCRTG